ncbi:hypothetical protein J6590_088219 [Homalodisca vitripennis]|nr:hypothetical protein J6590_088219 [Homalodisca vitripennis]
MSKDDQNTGKRTTTAQLISSPLNRNISSTLHGIGLQLCELREQSFKQNQHAVDPDVASTRVFYSGE